jgi:alpha/beta superfamily hydrolase
VHEVPVEVGSPPRRLDGRVSVPAGAAGGAVLCHPHPEYGGDMNHPVVTAAARTLAAAGRATLRFNFGGVGRSQGQYGGGDAEVEDARAALAVLAGRLPPGAPLALVGYSFGAWVALRVACEGATAGTVVAIAPPLAFFDWDFLAALPVPTTFVVGDRDQYCPPDRLGAVRAAHRARIGVCALAGADHFLGGREGEVAAAVLAALS